MIQFISHLLTSGDPGEMVAGALLLLGGAAFAVCGTALAYIDVQEHRLPNRIVYPWAGLAFGLLILVSLLVNDAVGLGRAVVAGLGWGLLFLLVRLASPRAIGMGDVKLSVVLGLYTGFLGWEVFAAGLVFSFLLGGLVSLALLISRRATSSTRIAFGPFLILGSAMALMFS